MLLEIVIEHYLKYNLYKDMMLCKRIHGIKILIHVFIIGYISNNLNVKFTRKQIESFQKERVFTRPGTTSLVCL